MAKVLGIGGVFFKASDPEGLYSWYEKHLALERTPGAGVIFPWRRAEEPDTPRMTVWSLFPKDTEYFGKTNPAFMVNYIVDDLDGMLEVLRAAGANVDDRREDSEYGRFAWVTDPEGNRVELWEPPK
ncbi:MAG TPA: VOC family protein [Isosphaeraceae bacterium]|jgi:catechol 2,3-dioxygenase-like lactoylglutathione lyase family enzyme|nr:VOC family protein [Isosphaeraceae bacterium]